LLLPQTRLDGEVGEPPFLVARITSIVIPVRSWIVRMTSSLFRAIRIPAVPTAAIARTPSRRVFSFSVLANRSAM